MIEKVKVKDIKPNPFQARKTDDDEAIESLAAEIKKVGLWAGAMRGRRNGSGVELCFGHRRLKAVKSLGWKDVDVDVVELTDREMSIQGLAENLQRQGLNDVDKGEAILSHIKILEGSGITVQTVIKDELRSFLNLEDTRINELIQLARFGEEAKEEVRQGNIAGSVAVEAARIGGEEMVKTAAEKGMTQRQVKDIGKAIRDIPDEKIREKVKASVVKGKVTKPEEVVTKARQMEAAKKPKDDMPPDLIDVIRGWTERIKRWNDELDAVKPYQDYIDREPAVANRWRNAVRSLTERLEGFL